MKFTANKQKQLVEAFAEKCDQVNSLRASKLKNGISFRNLTFDVSPESEIAMTNFVMSVTTDYSCQWRSNENVMLDLDDASARSFFSKAREYASAVRKRAWELKDGLDALKSSDDVKAFDISQGWPISED